nr:UPF0449 protein C19orf25 homolog isoform X2 [Anolis sagrei ordinatus]
MVPPPSTSTWSGSKGLSPSLALPSSAIPPPLHPWDAEENNDGHFPVLRICDSTRGRCETHTHTHRRSSLSFSLSLSRTSTRVCEDSILILGRSEHTEAAAMDVRRDLPTPAKNEDPEAKRERLYRLTQSYVEMNHRLQKACSLLKEKCEELKLAGATLEQGILEMKQRAL